MFLALPVRAEGLRLAVLHAGLAREGPGLLLRDIRAGSADVLAVRDQIVAVRPDILLLLRFDFDHDLVALRALAALLADAGHNMEHLFAWRPNSGMATGLDLDGDGRMGTADDAQGYGRFAGAGGMALLARLPVNTPLAVDYSPFLWRDLPDALLPEQDGALFPSEAVFAVQRLSSTGHWQIPLLLPDGRNLNILAWHAGPPAFGGAAGRNRRRNHDETAFWTRLLDGALPFPPPEPPFVLMGNANLDPLAGDGMRAAIRGLLTHPMVQDPQPRGLDPRTGEHSMVNGYWPRGVGALRVLYLLPDAGQQVTGSGLLWPEEGSHALVWVDLALPAP